MKMTSSQVRPFWLASVVAIAMAALVAACRISEPTLQPTPPSLRALTPTPSPTQPQSVPSPTPAAGPIKSFEDCANAGYPVMESYPRQCRTPDGRVFVEELPPEEREKLKPPSEICQDLCGDGICQEVVCQAVGCPCPETAESCPQDCGRSFDRSRYCPDYGDCADHGLESRKCEEQDDCVASCAYGCVSRSWLEGRADCEATWPGFECHCLDGVCQRY